VFKPVEREINFPASEARWLDFWQEKRIFAKQLAQGERRAEAEGKATFVFYEGPPTANGMPHPGHVLTRVVKDIFPRFRAMRGYNVPRKAGWDTHGLPVEIEVEKELGIEGKRAIEEYGVEAFVRKCRDSVFRYSGAWRKLTERIGFWVDLDDPYVTYHESYIESVWWSLKHFWDAGLMYHGHKIVPWCPRCGTALSSHEVGQGYREVADPSIFVAFRSQDDPKVLFAAWTTTPWTLISNVALAVGRDFTYDYVKSGNETLVMASALRTSVMGKTPHEVIKTVKGAELVGLKYEQLFPFVEPDRPAFRIVPGDFVGLDVGTGIVHIAPAFGEDDYRMGQENDLPMFNPVRPDGTFDKRISPWAGKFVKEADSLIVKDLKERKQLIKSGQYIHDYPFCWRCPSPLLYYPRPAWYIRTSSIKDKMLVNNARIEWLPEHIRDGRFGNFLESNVDWALSRERYWGTPLPVWECACGQKDALGGKQELLDRAINRDGLPKDFELHKPWVDQVVIACGECGGGMRRVPEVIDCWYDSGAMPFAQWGYPHQPGSLEKLEKALPADFISEAIDQTRGWFYSLLAISTLLKECAETRRKTGKDMGDLSPWDRRDYPLPYKKCLVLGLLLSEDGLKLSKKLRNYPDPFDVLDQEGADAMRWFFSISNQPWTSTRFFQGGIREAQKDFLVRLRNVYSFFVIYANIDDFDPRCGLEDLCDLSASAFGAAPDRPSPERRGLLDRWMLSKLETAAREVTANLESMNILSAAQALAALVEQLSNWYVRRSRDRFWSSEKNGDKTAAYWTLYEVLCRTAVLSAPFTPFFAEELYQNLVRALWPGSLPESVHLCRWPEPDLLLIDSEVEGRMDLVREIASLGLAARASRKLKVRQPLAKAVVILTRPEDRAGVEELAAVIREEINVKDLAFAEDAGRYVEFAVKPNFQILGPILGKSMKACAVALAERDAAEVVRRLKDSSFCELEFNGRKFTLSREQVELRLSAKEGFAAADGKGAVVVLDTQITEELEREGIARELINRIQTFRKELDLPFEARIRVRIDAAGKPARAAIEHAGNIAAETLASDFKVEFEDLGETREFELAGEKVRVSIIGPTEELKKEGDKLCPTN
ncbi:MAG: isoleucine--tRNA ligase, partial [Planctomycetes bacterium]|nr:isoleucine--tRNA ligase [Planctomycetota bacterium]